MGQRTKGEPPQLTGIRSYDVTTIDVTKEEKDKTFVHLYRVLRFIHNNVERSDTYLLSRRTDQFDGQYTLCLHKLTAHKMKKN